MAMMFALLFSLTQLLMLTTAIWPQPAEITNGSSVVRVSPTVKTIYEGGRGTIPYKGPFRVDTNLPSEAELVNDAFARFKSNLESQAYIPWKFHPKGSEHEPASSDGSMIEQITVQKVVPPRMNSSGEIDESYTLDLSKDGKVVIKAATAQGTMHGLTTLSQLFYKTSKGILYTTLAPLSIKDKPVYSHRGLNIDIARNFEAPATVKKLLDGMAFNKFNKLHIHATDSQSWPLEISTLSELARQGAYAPSLIWSVADLQSVQAYAHARGIETIIEIDSPGHTASIAYSHPDLIAAFKQSPWSTFCNEPPCGQVKLGSPAVRTFFDKILADLLPRVAPYGRYFHTGGDELNVNVYTLDETVGSNETAQIQPKLASFLSGLHSRIRAAGLAPLVWEEMVTEPWSLPLPTNDTLVQTWLAPDSVANVTRKGYRVLFGEYNYWYLDCGYGQWVDPNATNPDTTIVPPYADYCSPQKSWRQMYAYDPTANITDAQAKLLVGGEAHMWGELTDAANLDGKVWPRASAPAEVMWSGPKGVKGVNEAVTRRLADMRERMVGLGFAASVVQMTWCLQNIGGCVT